MELTEIKGIGKVTVNKLTNAGITSVEQLAELDMRKKYDDIGIPIDTLKRYKKDAKGLVIKSKGREAGKAVKVTADKVGRAIGTETKKVGEQIKLTAHNTSAYFKKGADDINLKIDGVWHKNIPIIKESFKTAEGGMKDFGHDIAVHMDEGTEKVRVWFKNQWHNDIPLIQEKTQGFFAKVKSAFAKKQ